jgi:hypothetical protein
MRALHRSCPFASTNGRCKRVEDALCSVQQAGTLNVSKNLFLAQNGKTFGSPPYLVQDELCRIPLSTLGQRFA